MKQAFGVLSIFVFSSIFSIHFQRNQTVYADTSSPQLNASNQNITATVKASLLNIRENQSLSSEIVGYLKTGANITIQEEQSGWAKISGIQGWVFENFITKDTPTIAGPPT